MALIYDFIYVDRDRIASLYAQIFGGHLLTVEKFAETTKENNISIAGKIPGVAEGEFAELQKGLESVKSTIDPYEIRTIDVLSKLIKMGRSGNSSIIIEEGHLRIFDDFVIELWNALLDSFSDLKEKLEKEEGKNAIVAFETFIKQSRKSLNLAPRPLPCTFLLKTNQNIFGGTVKEKYLSEPVSTYYIKHGDKWLKNIILIGLKEEAETVPLGKEEKGMLALLSESWPKLMRPMDSLLPSKTISVVPLALMRRIGKTEEEEI